jgi:hypothetical protein
MKLNKEIELVTMATVYSYTKSSEIYIYVCDREDIDRQIDEKSIGILWIYHRDTRNDKTSLYYPSGNLNFSIFFI